MTQKQETPRNGSDDRHHMGLYGTFPMDSIHGRLFEMQVYIESLKYHMLVYFAFVIISLLIWPVAALLAIPVAYIAGKDKELQMFKVILVLASFIGFVLWLIPGLIIAAGGGIEHFKKLIFEKELNFLDFVDFFLSETMILLTVVFSWVYHEISLDTEKYKNAAKASWKDQRGDYGTSVTFPKAQLHRLQKVVSGGRHFDNSEGRRSARGETPSCKDGIFKAATPTATPRQEDGEGTMAIEDVVAILEALPGWPSRCLDVQDRLSPMVGEETGLFAELASLSEEGKQKKIWPIDIWLTRTQFYPEVVIDLKAGLIVAMCYTRDMILIILDYIQQNILATVGLTFLALARTILPRIWLGFVLGGKFWPTDTFGDAGKLVFYSSVVSFVTSFLWLGLFYLILMEYRRTLCQMTIISALVDARTRVTFSQSFLMSCFWFGMGPEESEAVLGKLPLLDLRTSSNAAAFWRLREYCTLDRCNERMAISILLEIVIIWLFLKFITTWAVMVAYGGLPAILIVTLFDLVVFGGMALVALQVALKINSMMDQHKQSFVEAKYEVTMAYGRFMHDISTKDDLGKKHDLELARRLLTEYLDMTNESDLDARDSILFGMVVTPSAILSSMATGGAMVGTLVAKMLKNGTVHVPPSVENAIKLSAAGHSAATSFLAMYKSAGHFLSQHHH